jgi:hypothetical protein
MATPPAPDVTRARRLVTVLVVAHVALHALALLVCKGPPAAGSDLLRVMAVFALFTAGPGQGALLAIWTVFGNGRFLWRTLSVAVGALLYVWLVGLAERDEEFVLCTIGELGFFTVLLCVARLTGLKLLRFSDVVRALGPSQFYIRDMLVWMTALAMLMSAWRCLPSDAIQFHESTMPAGVPVGLAIVAGATMFSMLGRGWVVVRIVSLPLAIGIAAVWLAWSVGELNRIGSNVILLGVMALWLLASLLVLRLAGYRLAWRPELAQRELADPQGD